MKWEYYIHAGFPEGKRTGAVFLDDLNAFGRQGWEAVGNIGSQGHPHLLLKRALPE